MYSIIQLFPNLPRSIRRDLPRCTPPPDPPELRSTSTSTLRQAHIRQAQCGQGDASTSSHWCNQLFMYSIIHVFYYSCILLFMYSIIQLFPNLPRSIRRDLPRCDPPELRSTPPPDPPELRSTSTSTSTSTLTSSPPLDPAGPATLHPPARPAGTSLNLNPSTLRPFGRLRGVQLRGVQAHIRQAHCGQGDAVTSSHWCNQLFMYSIIHVFYYSIIPQPPPLDPAGPATLQTPARPAGTSLNLNLTLNLNLIPVNFATCQILFIFFPTT
jgi:hypothetical protein